MVGHTSLREVVGSDLLRAVAGSNLASSHLRLCVVPLLLLNVIQLGAQECECLRLVLDLRLFCLTVHNDTGRIMRQTHRRVRRIDTLSTVSGCTHYIDPDIFFFNLNVDVVVDLRHHRNADRRGVDPSAGFCLGHTLYTVHTALILEHRVSALSGHHKGDALHAANADLLGLYQLNLPMTSLRVMHIHTVNFRSKQRRLISARTRTDLHDDILIVVRILGKQQDLQLTLQLLHALLGRI